MMQLIYLFGPAAITYLIIDKCSKERKDLWYMAAIKICSYALVDLAVIVLLLTPFDKVKTVYSEAGILSIQYGFTAVILSVPISIIVGLVLSSIDIDIIPIKKKGKENEKNKKE